MMLVQPRSLNLMVLVCHEVAVCQARRYRVSLGMPHALPACTVSVLLRLRPALYTGGGVHASGSDMQGQQGGGDGNGRYPR